MFLKESWQFLTAHFGTSIQVRSEAPNYCDPSQPETVKQKENEADANA